MKYHIDSPKIQAYPYIGTELGIVFWTWRLEFTIGHGVGIKKEESQEEVRCHLIFCF